MIFIHNLLEFVVFENETKDMNETLQQQDRITKIWKTNKTGINNQKRIERIVH